MKSFGPRSSQTIIAASSKICQSLQHQETFVGVSYPLNTGNKLNVLCTFNLRHVSRRQHVDLHLLVILKFDHKHKRLRKRFENSSPFFIIYFQYWKEMWSSSVSIQTKILLQSFSKNTHAFLQCKTTYINWKWQRKFGCTFFYDAFNKINLIQ